VVVALGGNALARPGEPATIANQFRHTRESLEPIVAFAKDGWNIALVHGNGPQVGDELVRNELAAAVVEPLPLGVLVAGTAGWIGYMIQQSLENALRRAKVDRLVVTMVTQTLVDQYDPALSTPSKPIGTTLTVAQADRLKARGFSVREEKPGEWRRLTASPMPLGIIEEPLVKRLVGDGVIVVAAGGGGPPVYRDRSGALEGLDAVVDKDRVCAILARDLRAEVLLILTGVDAVYRDWGRPTQTKLSKMSLAEADQMLASGELEKGSIAPKIEAAAQFVREGGGRSVIATLSEGPAALKGLAGTTITRD
jgi:carbamate kinase